VVPGLLKLAHPQRGHFDLGTGYHGDLRLDLDALFSRPAELRPQVQWLAERLREHEIDAVCGPVEGGAFLALAVADVLQSRFLPAYRARAESTAYRLPRVRGGIAGWRVALVDDAINAGTAIRACSDQLRAHGAEPTALAALLSLGPGAGAIAESLAVPFYAAETVASQAWPAAQCPMCDSGVPLADPEASQSASVERSGRGGGGPAMR
jgi:orotate phosphoribosyltransferase